MTRHKVTMDSGESFIAEVDYNEHAGLYTAYLKGVAGTGSSVNSAISDALDEYEAV